jgi:hypothetical protein
MAGEIKSIRSNQVPQGGATVTTDPSQGMQYLPNTATLYRISELLMANSEYNVTRLNALTLVPAQQNAFQIRNVGLGESLETLITGTISLNNAAGVPQVVQLAPDFPFNIIQRFLVEFNGSTPIDNLSGPELLTMMAKRHKGVYIGDAASAGAAYAQTNTHVSSSVAWCIGDANITCVAGTGLTGVSSISIGAAAAGVLTFGMYLRLPFTVREDLLLGLLPMQNNSVYADVQLTLPTLLGIDARSPLFVAGAIPGTLTMTANAINCQPDYNFWAIPNPNRVDLYKYLCSHNYMLISQQNNIQAATGAEGLQYNMPLNYFLMSMLLTLRDSTQALADPYTMLDLPFLDYNGTARYDRRGLLERQARQNMFYEGIPAGFGQLIYDGTDIEYLSNGSNMTRWIDMYQANNPRFVADVAAAFAVPGTYSVLREQLCPANVQLV